MPQTEQETRVAVIGAGGLGTPALWALLASKLGLTSEAASASFSISIFDPDTVELSNLNRQVWFRESDLGQPKACILAERLLEFLNLSPQSVQLKPQVLPITETNAAEMLSGASYIIDACDCTKTKFLLNDFAVENAIAHCYGGVNVFSGQLMEVRPGGACLRCLFENFSESDYTEQTANCQQNGILGAAAGHIGFKQAEKALFYLSYPTPADGCSELIRWGFKPYHCSSSNVHVSPRCPWHSQHIAAQKDSAASNHTLHLEQQRCPMTFLYTKLALEKIPPGTRLEAVFSSKESAEKVQGSVLREGHKLLHTHEESRSGTWRLVIEKKH